ncbi:N-acetyltransferase family protein [Actinotalea sp.]|uniref:GNAT family N-acetyltransferase n=1 Tax=Actinotalea sp. TaxID=1872145 RepID=UPI003565D937
MVDDLIDLNIRPARVEDARGIAEAHIAAWRQAYADVVAESYLANLDVEARTAQWAEILENPAPRTRVLVAEEDGAVAGFAMIGPSRDEDAELGGLEIYSIYLQPEAWGHGVARELMRTILAEVPSEVPVTLWVLAANARARHFYRRHGFTPDGVERLDPIGEENHLEVRYRRN